MTQKPPLPPTPTRSYTSLLPSSPASSPDTAVPLDLETVPATATPDPAPSPGKKKARKARTTRSARKPDYSPRQSPTVTELRARLVRAESVVIGRTPILIDTLFEVIDVLERIEAHLRPYRGGKGR